MSAGLNGIFPTNPTDKMIVEIQSGLLYQYDASIRSWIKISSDNYILQLATPISAGAMSAVDLKKINRLVVPPPLSTIIGTDCIGSFKHGGLTLSGGDDFVNVDGDLTVRNTDAVGDEISTELPFHIHQHTYGFDFNLNLPALVDELKNRNQYQIELIPGDTGRSGAVGKRGINGIPAGPAGNQGEAGTVPPTTLTIEPDPVHLSKQSGSRKGIVNVKVVPNRTDPTQYDLVFDRQTLGPTNASTTQFRVQRTNSKWVLVVTSTAAAPQQLYYLDIEPILDTINLQFLKEVGVIQRGYQQIVRFWINTMSDLFDEQKTALCCSLEHCMSVTKNNAIREHIESVAGAAAGYGRVRIHDRYSNEAVQLSGTNLLPLIGQTDVCATSPNAAAPSAVSQIAPLLFKLTIDPLLNNAANTASTLELPAGSYVAIIEQTTAQIDGKHRANLKIQYINAGAQRAIQFIDKGSFYSLIDSKNAYEGLAVEFSHEGGLIKLWLPSFGPHAVSGSIDVSIKSTVTTLQSAANVQTCQMTVSHFSSYINSLVINKCCSVIIDINGQEYVIIKRSIGTDLTCGGGESLTTACMTTFDKRPAFAWPILNGAPVPLPANDSIIFKYDPVLNDLVGHKLANGEYSGKSGMINQFDLVLFPIS